MNKRKMFLALFDSRGILLLLFCICLIPVVMGEEQNLFSMLFVGHYGTTILNVVWIGIVYARNHQIEHLQNMMVPRMGKARYLRWLLAVMAATICGYCVLVYGSALLLCPFPEPDMMQLFLWLITGNTILYVVLEAELIFLIGSKRKWVYLIAAIVTNFIYHYGFIIRLF